MHVSRWLRICTRASTLIEGDIFFFGDLQPFGLDCWLNLCMHAYAVSGSMGLVLPVGAFVLFRKFPVKVPCKRVCGFRTPVASLNFREYCSNARKIWKLSELFDVCIFGICQYPILSRVMYFLYCCSFEKIPKCSLEHCNVPRLKRASTDWYFFKKNLKNSNN